MGPSRARMGRYCPVRKRTGKVAVARKARREATSTRASAFRILRCERQLDVGVRRGSLARNPNPLRGHVQVRSSLVPAPFLVVSVGQEHPAQRRNAQPAEREPTPALPADGGGPAQRESPFANPCPQPGHSHLRRAIRRPACRRELRLPHTRPDTSRYGKVRACSGSLEAEVADERLSRPQIPGYEVNTALGKRKAPRRFDFQLDRTGLLVRKAESRARMVARRSSSVLGRCARKRRLSRAVPRSPRGR